MNLRKILTDYKQFEIFILGMISGMPIAIIFSTLAAWLTESGVSLEIVTTFGVSRLAYSLKVFWSPVVDYLKIPLLGNFGHRKSWLIFCSIGISITLFTMSELSPTDSLSYFYFLTICLGIFSATFDISFDAFRIERFEQSLQGIAAANTVFGYRIGMLITSAGALYWAHISNNWSETFSLMGVIFLISSIFILTVKEVAIEREKLNNISFINSYNLVLAPFKDFLLRDKAITVLLAVILFKLGDAMLGVVSTPFYLKIGYNKEQIAIAVKMFGVIATILGTYAGGFVIYSLGSFKGLIITGIIQSITHIAFIWLNHQGGDYHSLFVAISIENFGGGMGSVALVAYLSVLCNKKYSATQYAMLSAIASFFNNSITIYSGKLVTMLGWDNYFIFTMVLAIPGIIVLIYLNRYFVNKVIKTQEIREN